MRIMVFKNKYKEEERHPDYEIYKSEEGKDLVKVGALWKGRSAKAGDFFSGSLDFSRLHEDAEPHQKRGYITGEPTEDDDSSIPF